MSIKIACGTTLSVRSTNSSPWIRDTNSVCPYVNIFCVSICQYILCVHMFCNFLRHKDTQNILFLLTGTILPWSHRAAPNDCADPQILRTTNKTYAKKNAKVRKNQLKKICTCCFEHGHNSTQFLFWWVYQPKLLMHNTRNRGDKQRLILYILSTWW